MSPDIIISPKIISPSYLVKQSKIMQLYQFERICVYIIILFFKSSSGYIYTCIRLIRYNDIIILRFISCKS